MILDLGFKSQDFFWMRKMSYEIQETICGIDYSLMLMQRIFKVKVTGDINDHQHLPIVKIIDPRILNKPFSL